MPSDGAEFLLELMCKMESCGVRPDKQFYCNVVDVFGRASEPAKKCIAMYYWMGYFKDKNPYQSSLLRRDAGTGDILHRYSPPHGDGPVQGPGRSTAENAETAADLEVVLSHQSASALSKEHIGALALLRMMSHLGGFVVPYPGPESLSGTGQRGFILGSHVGEDHDSRIRLRQVLKQSELNRDRPRAYISGPSSLWLGEVCQRYYSLSVLGGECIAVCVLDEDVYSKDRQKGLTSWSRGLVEHIEEMKHVDLVILVENEASSLCDDDMETRVDGEK